MLFIQIGPGGAQFARGKPVKKKIARAENVPSNDVSQIKRGHCLTRAPKRLFREAMMTPLKVYVLIMMLPVLVPAQFCFNYWSKLYDSIPVDVRDQVVSVIDVYSESNLGSVSLDGGICTWSRGDLSISALKSNWQFYLTLNLLTAFAAAGKDQKTLPLVTTLSNAVYGMIGLYKESCVLREIVSPGH